MLPTRHRSFTVDLGPVEAENVDISLLEANFEKFRTPRTHDANSNPDEVVNAPLKGLIIGWTPVSMNSLHKNWHYTNI